MKKTRWLPVCKVLLFLLIFFGLLFRFSYILRPTITTIENNEKLNLLGYYGEAKNSFDMLYFGSSDATVYWMPYNGFREAGISSYTYGKSMMRASMFEDLLDEALKTQSPSLVVVSMRTILESGDTVEEAALRSVTDTLPYTSLNRWKMIWRNRHNIVLTSDGTDKGGSGLPTQNIFDILPFYFDIWKYHDNWDDIWEDSYNFGRLGEFTSNTKGFLIRTFHKAQERDASVPGITETLPLSETVEKALLALMRKADERGFDLLFVMAPYCESERSRMLYNSAAELIAEKGYRSFDFNEVFDEIGIDLKTDFYDERHLNTLGAEKYTSYFINYLNENYDLPDHRREAAYADWVEDLTEWAEIETQALKDCRSLRKKLPADNWQ